MPGPPRCLETVYTIPLAPQPVHTMDLPSTPAELILQYSVYTAALHRQAVHSFQKKQCTAFWLFAVLYTEWSSPGAYPYIRQKKCVHGEEILLFVHIFDHLTAEMEPEIIQSVYHTADSKESYTTFAEKMCMSS